MLFTSRAPAAAAVTLGVVSLFGGLGTPATAVPVGEMASPVGGAPAAPDGRNEILVSITAPRQVDPGHDATFGVTVKTFDDGQPLANTVVVLVRRAAGEGAWAEADRTQTDGNGRAILSAQVRPPATDFKARVPGDDLHRGGRSARVTVTVTGG